MFKINNLVFVIDSIEIILNIFKLYNHNNNLEGVFLIKKGLNSMSDKEISYLLKHLKNNQNLEFVNNMKLILRHVINDKRYNIFTETFKEFIQLEINDEKKPNLEENYSTFSFSKVFSDIIKEFLDENKGNKFDKSNSLFTYVFKALFFELFETSENSRNHIKDSNNSNLNKYKIKQIDSNLYKYLCYIIDFFVKFKFNVNKEIILELLYFVDSIYKDYEKNMKKKNSDSICIFNHIFTKKIMEGIFELISEYQRIMVKNLYGKKYYIKEEFNNYDKFISFLFHNNLNPGYLFEIKEILEDQINLKEKIFFVEEIIEIISKEKEDKKDINENKIFYRNLIELINILYSSSLSNNNLAKEKEYEKIFNAYFNFLNQNKYLFSQYIIPISDHTKTIFEYCIDLSIQIDIDYFIKLFYGNDYIKTYLLKLKNLKEKNYENSGFNKFLKSLNFKKK